MSLPGPWSRIFSLMYRDHVGMRLWLLAFSALSLQAWGKYFSLGQKCFGHQPQLVSLENCPLQAYHSSPPDPCCPRELSSDPSSLLRWALVLRLPSLPGTPHLQCHGHRCDFTKEQDLSLGGYPYWPCLIDREGHTMAVTWASVHGRLTTLGRDSLGQNPSPCLKTCIISDK